MPLRKYPTLLRELGKALGMEVETTGEPCKGRQEESFPHRTSERNGMSKGLRTLWSLEHYQVQKTVRCHSRS